MSAIVALFGANLTPMSEAARPTPSPTLNLSFVAPVPQENVASVPRRRERPVAPVVKNEHMVRVLLYSGAGPVKVTAEGHGVLVNGKKARTAEVTLVGENIDRECKFTAEGGLVKFQGQPYRGWLEAHPYNGKMQVINVVDLEDYLRGVVPKELLAKELEAVKAQAILARTYAVSMAGKSDDRSHWDLRDDTGHQVYGGAAAEHSTSDEAVRQTKGQVLAYQGKICGAVLYHSTCGGYTDSNANVYGTPLIPYLTGVSCGLKAWEAKASEQRHSAPESAAASTSHRPSTLAERRALRDSGRHGRREKKASPTVSTRSGGLGLNFSLGTEVNDMSKRFRYTSGGTSAWCNGSAFARWEACWTPDELGQELGRKLGKSSYPIVGLNVVERTSSGRVKRLNVRFANGAAIDIGGDTVRNTLCYRNAKGAWCSLPSTRFEVVEVSAKTVRVRGTGWGHGVGMCQWGAKELAHRGYDAANILGHYYAGTEVCSLETLGSAGSSR